MIAAWPGAAPARTAIAAARQAAAADPDLPVTVFLGQALSLASPDRLYRLVGEAAGTGEVRLVVLASGAARDRRRQVIGTFQPPTRLLWSPGSDAFILNDQRGSGQTSYLEIVRLVNGRFHRDRNARRNLAALLARRFECRLAGDYVVTSAERWHDRRTIVANVQANLHSGGCPLDPHASHQVTVLVDARTGKVRHRRLAPAE